MIKWIAILLVVLNVMVFIGRDKLPEVSQDKTIGPPAIDLQHMMLVNEGRVPSNADEAIAIEEEQLAKVNAQTGKVASKAQETPKDRAKVRTKLTDLEPTGMVVKIDESMATGQSAGKKKALVTPIVPKPKVVAKVASNAVVVAGVLCYRVGPMQPSKDLNMLLDTLQAAEIDYQKKDVDNPSSLKAARVFIGPFASTADLKAQQAQLKAKKIDSFVLRRPNGRIIQLGYFSKQGEALSNAQNFQKRVEKKGVKVKISPEYVGGGVSSVVSFKTANQRLAKMDLNKLAGKAKVTRSACQ